MRIPLDELPRWQRFCDVTFIYWSRNFAQPIPFAMYYFYRAYLLVSLFFALPTFIVRSDPSNSISVACGSAGICCGSARSLTINSGADARLCAISSAGLTARLVPIFVVIYCAIDWIISHLNRHTCNPLHWFGHFYLYGTMRHIDPIRVGIIEYSDKCPTWPAPHTTYYTFLLCVVYVTHLFVIVWWWWFWFSKLYVLWNSSL